MDKKYPILFFSTADWDSIYKTNKHYVAEELSKIGYKVFFFESFGIRKPNIFDNKDKSRLFKKLTKSFSKRKINKNLTILSILTIPLWSSLIIRKINYLIIQFKLINLNLKYKRFHVWSYHPFIPKKLIKKSKSVIYHSVDDISLVRGVDKNSFKKQEEYFSRKADYIFVSSKKLLKKYQKNKTYFFSNVIDSKILKLRKNTKVLKNIKEPIVGFFGNLTETKIDYKLLDYSIKNLNNFLFVFLGEENENEKNNLLLKLRKYNNTLFLGVKNHTETIKIAKNFNVGLIPFLKNNYTDNIFPMKYYEYIASGARVVSTNLDFTKQVSKKFLKVANSKEQFKRYIRSQSQKNNIKKNDIKFFLNQNTYSSRTKKMLEICKI